MVAEKQNNYFLNINLKNAIGNLLIIKYLQKRSNTYMFYHPKHICIGVSKLNFGKLKHICFGNKRWMYDLEEMEGRNIEQ